MEIDVDDIINGDYDADPIIARKDKEPEVVHEDVVEEVVVSDVLDINILYERLKEGHEKCRDLFVDLRAITYDISEDDTFIDFHDKSYYKPRLYFKVDLQNPKDAKVIHATKQLCKIIGIPYTFFASCRPSLKKNVFKTWQSGLGDDTKKSQNVLKIRESRDCTIIRAITSTSKSFIPLYQIIEMIRDSLGVPVVLSEAFGDDKDDLVFHARFLFEKEYDFNGPIQLGFSITASELDACPLTIDVLLYNKITKTYCSALYGGESFFKSDYKGLQSSTLKSMLPHMITRIEDEVPEMLSRIETKQKSFENSIFCAESEAIELGKFKGLTSAIKKAIYHEVSECLDDIQTPWDLAIHVGLVAKDFEILKRVQIEKAVGVYLNLFFSEGGEGEDAGK